eukprot:13726437-Alexandrium_andersonii.AAC.1
MRPWSACPSTEPRWSGPPGGRCALVARRRASGRCRASARERQGMRGGASRSDRLGCRQAQGR